MTGVQTCALPISTNTDGSANGAACGGGPMAHWIGVSDYCIAITGGPIVVIVVPTTAAESMSQTIATESMSPTTVLLESVTELMSLTTVLLESVTELMLLNRCLRSMVIFFFDPTVIIFIVISTGHNFEIQMVNSNLTLNPMVNLN